MNEHDEAREALDQIAATRRETANQAASPKGYYTLAGFGMALMIVGIGIDGSVRWTFYVLGLLTMLGAMQWYSKHTGIVTWATLRERGAWRAWVIIAVSLVGVFVALLGQIPAVCAAIVTWVVWTFVGPKWDAAWVRSIEEQP